MLCHLALQKNEGEDDSLLRKEGFLFERARKLQQSLLLFVVSPTSRQRFSWQSDEHQQQQQNHDHNNVKNNNDGDIVWHETVRHGDVGDEHDLVNGCSGGENELNGDISGSGRERNISSRSSEQNRSGEDGRYAGRHHHHRRRRRPSQ